MKRLHKIRWRCLAGIMAVTLASVLSAGWMAGAIQGYTGGRLTLVTEPGESSSYMKYYVGDNQKPVGDMVWVDGGHTGKAVSLTGAGEYLEIGYQQLRMHTMTFSGWFLWRGATSGQDEKSMYSQRLFTLSRNDDIWLTVKPHAKDETRIDKDGKIIDGVYMGFAMGDVSGGVNYEFWNPAVPGRESYGLPLNDWHHVAMTMDGQSLKLYIDGRLWFERMLILGVEEMQNNFLSIGSGRWDDPTLNALVDDMAVYDYALNANQIAMLDAGVDPLAAGASLPETTAPSLPQAPTSATASTTEQNNGGAGDGLFGLPAGIAWLIGGLVALFVVLSIVLSIYHPTSPPQNGQSATPPQQPPEDDGKGGGKL